MFEVSVEHTFAAGHALRNYKGKCENVHGHNYRVRVTVEGENLNSAGLLVDFSEVKSVIRNFVERLDHQFLNDLKPFDELNPSAENLAKYVHDGLG
ncbi:MAG TPA: 6-carboxytetrahydropterin synthase QueD, partial [Terriglobia bacterium]|nr:6-carboxytetrahydropterin synthase QueD [Terriglobia bacterium]